MTEPTAGRVGRVERKGCLMSKAIEFELSETYENSRFETTIPYEIVDGKVIVDLTGVSEDPAPPFKTKRAYVAFSVHQAAKIGWIDFCFTLCRVGNDREIMESDLDNFHSQVLERFDSNRKLIEGAITKPKPSETSWIDDLIRFGPIDSFLKEPIFREAWISSVEGKFEKVLEDLVSRDKPGGERALEFIIDSFKERTIEYFERKFFDYNDNYYHHRQHQVTKADLRKAFQVSEVTRRNENLRFELLKRPHSPTSADFLPLCLGFSDLEFSELVERLWAEGKAREFSKESKKLLSSISSAIAYDRRLSDYFVLSLLWHKIPLKENTAFLTMYSNIVELLLELPSDQWRRDCFWDEVGEEGQSAWRQEFFETVSVSKRLALGLVEFACRWLTEPAFSEVRPVLLRLLHDDEDIAELKSLEDSRVRLVQLRSKGLLLSVLDNDVGPPSYSTTPPLHLPALSRARTWLSDATAEAVIHDHLSVVEREFVNEYASHWGDDEEQLTSRILTRAQSALLEASKQLKLIRHRVRSGPVVTASYRELGKREEGSSSPGAGRPASDVIFLTKVRKGGRTIIQRSNLVQVKKRRASGSRTKFQKSISIDLMQCDDLIATSEHSFYLFFTPAHVEARLWVVPARFTRNMTSALHSRKSIACHTLNDSSISFADFFLKNVMGLWSGDEANRLVNLASGDFEAGKVARHIFEVDVVEQAD